MKYGFLPLEKDILLKEMEKRPVDAYRVSDMTPFNITGVGENVFIIKDRHGLEHTRQFSGRWLIKIKIEEYHNENNNQR